MTSSIVFFTTVPAVGQPVSFSANGQQGRTSPVVNVSFNQQTNEYTIQTQSGSTYCGSVINQSSSATILGSLPSTDAGSKAWIYFAASILFISLVGFFLFSAFSTGSPHEPTEYEAEQIKTAVMRSDLDEVKDLFRKNPAIVMARDKDDNTPLHFATSPAIASWLIENGAVVDAANKGSATPLHFLCQNFPSDDLGSNFDTVGTAKVLLDNGAYVNATTAMGRTPLFYASENGNTKLVKFLIDNQALVNMADESGDSPLSVAVNDDIVKLLRAAGAKTSDEISNEYNSSSN